ncbi:MAG TPA: xylose isomerase [Cytophagales bacterium]|jgi:sugar phosphate isomerase/epimerase|nr:xylose isomerase [Cytophagales bacterium]
MNSSRRNFIKSSAVALAGASLYGLYGCTGGRKNGGEMFFNISLAQWSLHKMLFANELTNLDFPLFAKNEFGITAVEYVNAFFKDKAKDQAYLSDLKSRTENEGIENVLIMIDGEGQLGNSDEAERKKAVENHYKWIEAANFLGCHSIRVNAAGEGDKAALKDQVVKSLNELCTFSGDYNVNVIVENHGGYSSNGEWLADTISTVGMSNCGTLPDFGNFIIDREKDVKFDRYRGMELLMPYAKGVSAKCYDFNEAGNETTIDFERMLNIVQSAGYNGYIGIEYEGSRLTEVEGVKAAKELLLKVGAKVS